MIETVQPSVALIEGDGGDETLSNEELTRLKDSADAICRDAGMYVFSRRTNAQAVRFCQWDGQSEDGLKHGEALRRDAFPFEGASDARVRLADRLTGNAVKVMTQAAKRMEVNVRSLKFADGDFAGRMRYLLRWVLKTHLGPRYQRELTRLANWVAGDSPGAAVLAVWWEQTDCIKVRKVKLDAVPMLLMQAGIAPELAQQVPQWVLDPTLDAMTVQWLTEVVPDIKAPRARKMVRELRETGETEFPQRHQKPGGPGLTALRLFEDIFVPYDTTDLKEAEMLQHREWLTEVSLRERETSHGYEAEFIEQVLKNPGKTGFNQYDSYGNSVTEVPFVANPVNEQRRFEVVTAWWRAMTEDGVVGIFRCTYSHFADVAGTKRELVDLPFDRFPFEWFGLEDLTQRLWDSRGIPEVVATEQFTLKRTIDSYRDGCDLAALPPFMRRASGGRAQAPILWGPLQENPSRVPGEVEVLTIQYPVGVDKSIEKIEKRVAEHFGQPHPDVSPDMVRLHAQTLVDNFLGPLGEVLMMLLQLSQANMRDEQLAAITGLAGEQLFATREDAQGEFRLEVSFNAGVLDSEYQMKMTESFAKNVLPILPPESVERARLGAVLVAQFDPSLADAVLVPMQAGQARDREKARRDLVGIMAGIEPDMTEQGNFGLQLETMTGDLQRNPEMMQKFTPVSKQILENHLEHLAGQVDQAQNAVTGRTMGKAVLQPSALDRVRQMLGKGDKTQR